MADLASFRNVGSDLKPVHGKAVILAWFSPRISMRGVSSFVTVLTLSPAPVKLVKVSSCKGDPENYFSRAGTPVKMQTCYGEAELEVLTALQQVSYTYINIYMCIFICASSLDSHGRQGCPISKSIKSIKLLHLACSNR